jgi:aminoglycoside 6'-N-acetyltransferase I
VTATATTITSVTAPAIRMPEEEDFAEWLRLRTTLWPECSAHQHELEMGSVLADSDRASVFVAAGEHGLAGFVEVVMRPWAEGCDTTPIGYVEGLYVEPEARGAGVARALLRAAEAWAADRGCREMASDTPVDNDASRAVHKSLGYEEGEVLIHFHKRIVPERVESVEEPE